MKRALQLVLVTETFPPEVNGVAVTLERWVSTFRARGHSVRVLRPRQLGEPPHPDLVLGMGLLFYPQVRLGMAGPAHLRRRLSRQVPDMIHIATEGPLGLATLIAAWSLGIPVASSFHTNFDHYASHYGFFGLQHLAFSYLQWFHNRTSLTLVPSQSTRSRLLKGGVQHVEIWSRGVDAQVFSPAHRDEAFRQTLGLAPSDPLLLYVGRLAPEKNLAHLIQAFARLRAGLPQEQRDRLKLALVGDGPMREELARAELPGVILAGMQRGQGLSRWYASSDVFAFPSQSETFGNVVLEAQASSLAVVGFDCQGVNEQVTTMENGILVPPEGDLTAPLARLCQDTELRKHLGAAARRRAEKLDWKPIFDGLEDRYHQIVVENERCGVG